MNNKGTNNGDCKKHLCECDKKFAEGFAKKFEHWKEENWQLDMQGAYESTCMAPKEMVKISRGNPKNGKTKKGGLKREMKK